MEFIHRVKMKAINAPFLPPKNPPIQISKRVNIAKRRKVFK